MHGGGQAVSESRRDILAAFERANRDSLRFEAAEDIVGRAAEVLSVDDDELWGMLAMHPSAAVRAAGLGLAERHLPRESAVELIRWHIHDPCDEVAMRAIIVAARAAVPGAAAELFQALGNSPSVLDNVVYSRSDLRQDLAAAALAFLLERIPDREAVVRGLLEAGYDPQQDASKQTLDTTGMRRVPGGEMTDRDGRLISGSEFHADERRVSVAEYADFLADVQETGHIVCHPGEPADYDHRPATVRVEPQQSPDDPVTGISWFDAFAFATWKGRSLPTSDQWSRFRHSEDSHAQADTVDTQPLPSARLAPDFAAIQRLVTGGACTTGALWEWTRTRHLDGRDIQPFIGRRDHVETLGDWTMYAVVRGGGIRSENRPVASSYCGRKHVGHKSAELSFRCVLEPLGH